jgi:glutathione peroxidase-family protein
MSVDQQDPSTLAKFVEKKEINYPVLLAEAKTTMDFGGIYGIPVAFLVNKAGNVVKKYSGYVDHAVLERDIRSLL